MNNPLISVIVPVYNVREHLERCLQSIVKQTYENIEILLIDDGSTDGSSRICDDYQLLDSRVTCIHKQNTGLADVRNIGVLKAKGTYLTFIDSDDTVEEDYVEKLYQLITTSGCELSLCTHRIVKGCKIWLPFKCPANGIITDKACIEKMLYSNGIDTSVWGKLYKKSLFENIEYPCGKIYEDIATTYKLFMTAGTIACTSQILYNYILRDNSIVSARFDKRNLDLLELTDKMGNDILKIYPELKEAVLRRRIYARFSTLNKMLDVNGYDEIKNNIILFIKSNTGAILKNNNTPLRDKIALLFLSVNFKLYCLVWKIFGKK